MRVSIEFSTNILPSPGLIEHFKENSKKRKKKNKKKQQQTFIMEGRKKLKIFHRVARRVRVDIFCAAIRKIHDGRETWQVAEWSKVTSRYSLGSSKEPREKKK
jgi:hypothetical protein